MLFIKICFIEISFFLYSVMGTTVLWRVTIINELRDLQHSKDTIFTSFILNTHLIIFVFLKLMMLMFRYIFQAKYQNNTLKLK